jgi:hypothetical protein
MVKSLKENWTQQVSWRTKGCCKSIKWKQFWIKFAYLW